MVVVLTTSTSTLFVLTLSLSLLFDILFHGHTNTFNGRHTYTYHCSHFASLLLLLVLRFLLSEWQRPPARAAWRMRRLHQERAHSLHTHTLSRTHARTHANTHAVCCLQSSATPLLLCWLPFVFARGQSLSQKVVLSGDCCFLLLRSRSKYLRTHKNKRKLV